MMDHGQTTGCHGSVGYFGLTLDTERGGSSGNGSESMLDLHELTRRGEGRKGEADLLATLMEPFAAPSSRLLTNKHRLN